MTRDQDTKSSSSSTAWISASQIKRFTEYLYQKRQLWIGCLQSNTSRGTTISYCFYGKDPVHNFPFCLCQLLILVLDIIVESMPELNGPLSRPRRSDCRRFTTFEAEQSQSSSRQKVINHQDIAIKLHCESLPMLGSQSSVSWSCCANGCGGGWGCIITDALQYWWT